MLKRLPINGTVDAKSVRFQFIVAIDVPEIIRPLRKERTNLGVSCMRNFTKGYIPVFFSSKVMCQMIPYF